MYNFIVMLIVSFFGNWNLPAYERSTSTLVDMPSDHLTRTVADYTNEDLNYIASQAKCKHLTYLFNIFVFLQLFNMINCRKIGRRDFNFF